MSHKQNLIQEYRELSSEWNGKSLYVEGKLQDLAGELEELGINVEGLE